MVTSVSENGINVSDGFGCGASLEHVEIKERFGCTGRYLLGVSSFRFVEKPAAINQRRVFLYVSTTMFCNPHHH